MVRSSPPGSHTAQPFPFSGSRRLYCLERSSACLSYGGWASSPPPPARLSVTVKFFPPPSFRSSCMFFGPFFLLFARWTLTVRLPLAYLIYPSPFVKLLEQGFPPPSPADRMNRKDPPTPMALVVREKAFFFRRMGAGKAATLRSPVSVFFFRDLPLFPQPIFVFSARLLPPALPPFPLRLLDLGSGLLTAHSFCHVSLLFPSCVRLS